jgi:hypothetical protein
VFARRQINFTALEPVGAPGFGLSNQILAQALMAATLAVVPSALYQIGGPRSIQLALKRQF